MENSSHIELDSRLNRNEIKEVTSYTQEKIKLLLETQEAFKTFINTEYKWANENYLKDWWKNVEDLQKKLWFNWKDLDGIFWKDTFFALVDFQRKNWLVPDWLAWPKTQEKLFWKVNIVPDYLLSKKEKDSLVNHFSKTYEVKSAVSLADFIKNEWYPRYESWASCWANVWDALLAFWMKDLPKSWRDWYKWSTFLDNNDNFIKVPISSPSEAKAWWVLVYDKWYWKTKDRQLYGHVEIALWNNQYYYGWWPHNKPGWSTNSWFKGYVYYPKVA